MRNLQVQTIFFSGNGFANNFFSYEMQCFMMRSFMLLHQCYHLLNNIGGPVFMLP